jgi:hypothetical protein
MRSIITLLLLGLGLSHNRECVVAAGYFRRAIPSQIHSAAAPESFAIAVHFGSSVFRKSE